MIDTALRRALMDSQGVFDLVADRIAAGGQIPQGDLYPAISFFCVTDQELRTLDNRPVGLNPSRWQFDCWANSQVQVVTLAKKVKDALQGIEATLEGTYIASALHALTTDQPEPEPNLFHRLVQFDVMYREVS